MRVLVLLLSLGMCSGKEFVDKFDRYIISCHTTDFECFKRQYKALRDNVLLGNNKFAIDFYEPFVFEYGGGTCVKISGLEESELVEIGMNSNETEYTMTIELPFKIQQIRNDTIPCVKPDIEFKDIKQQNDSLKRFAGNATVQISYPYELRKKKGDIYMLLNEENLDVVLDIPDLSNYNNNSELERKLYEASEWAYDVIQHIDAAHQFVLPYTSKLHFATERLPLRRFLLLYPEEEYHDLQFEFTRNLN